MISFWTMLWTAILLYAGLSFYRFWRSVCRFRDNNIPYEQPWWLVGNMGEGVLRKKFFFDIIKDAYNMSPNAKYVGFFDFTYPIVLIRDPELIKTIAVKHADKFPDHRGFINEKLDPLFGRNLFSLKEPEWHNIRTLLSPAFTSSKMKMMFQLMNECAENFSNFMLEQSNKGNYDVELKDIFTRYTNDVIATCAFGIKTDSMRDRNNDFYVLGRRSTDFDGLLSVKFFILRSFPLISKIFNIRLIEEHIHKFFTRVVSETVETRDRQKITRPDMIQLMMDARGKANELNIDDMTAQAFIFFFGGFDTVSTLMCFAAHEIAANPDVHKKLQAEVDDVWEKTKGKLTYDALNDMKYLDAIINEALRMYPPVHFADRVCVSELELPPTLPGRDSFTVKPGDNIWFPVYALQRDSQYFQNPDTFDPDRFYQKDVSTNHMAYLPFGVGPRICIGNRFALQEVKTVLFNLLVRCNFKCGPKTHVPMKFSKASFPMTAEGGFWIKLEPRKDTNLGFQTVNKNGSVTA